MLLLPGSAAGQVFEYYHTDAVGSARAITDTNGAVVERHDYLSFGEEWQPAPAPQPLRFTGKERDQESGLDYFGARYLRAGLGRFSTVDPIQTVDDNLVDPQRFNRYAYGRNNPLRYVDPDGRDIVLLVWSPGRDALGHSAVAVQRRNAAGETTGFTTIYHLWPAEVMEGKQTEAKGDYRVEVQKEVDLATFAGGEGHGADGMVRIKGDAAQDQKVVDRLQALGAAKADYVAPTNTCSTFAREGVEAAGIPVGQTGKVTITYRGMSVLTQKGVVTPVSVYNSVVDSGSPRVEVMKALSPSARNPDLVIK